MRRAPERGIGAAATVRTAAFVERLMRAGPPVVDPDERLATAAARMREAWIGALPVVQSGQLVGLLTERDFLLAVADGLSTDVVRVGSYMRRVPCVIGPEAGAAEAAARMVELRVRHLVVVREGDVVGLLSAADILGEWGVPPELLGDEQP